MINKIEPNIQFTIEEENNSELVFLDVTVKKVNNKFETSWHLKSTNTGIYINRHAHSPLAYKTAAIRTLIYRAVKICSNKDNFMEAYQKIQNIFVGNGFSYKFIQKIRDKVINSLTQTQTHSEEVSMKVLFWKMPFKKETEHSTRKTLNFLNKLLREKSVKVIIAYSTRKTSTFFPNKDKIPNSLKPNVIYQYKCDLCPGHTYTGESVRHWVTRKKEHLTGKPNPTEISLHHHRLEDSNFKIVFQTRHTKIGEALVYKTVPISLRLNAHEPGFRLKLFNFNAIRPN